MRYSFLLLILVCNLFSNQEWIIKATRKGVITPHAKLIYLELEGYDREGKPQYREKLLKLGGLCDTKKIQGKWAFRADCLKQLDRIKFTGIKGHGIRLTYWRETNDLDAEYTIAYSSVNAKSTALKIFHIQNRPKQEWNEQKLFLHGLNEYQLTEKYFEFTAKSSVINDYKLKLMKKEHSPGETNYSDPSRFKLFPLTNMGKLQEHSFWNNQSLWIHEISTFLEPAFDRSQYLSKTRLNYLTVLENPTYRTGISLICCFALVYLLWQLKRNLRIELLSNLVLPTGLVASFMLGPTMEYFESLEDIQLQKIQKEIEAVFTNIKKAEVTAKQRIHKRLIEQLPYLKNKLDQTTFLKNRPRFLTEKNILDTSSLSSDYLRTRIFEMQERFLNDILPSENNFFYARLKAYNWKHQRKDILNADRKRLEDIYADLSNSEKQELLKLIQKVEINTGVSLNITNLNCILRADEILPNTSGLSSFYKPLSYAVFRNVSTTAEQIAQMNIDKREAYLMVRERLSEINIDPQFITEYVHNPHKWHQISNHRRYSDHYTFSSWQLLESHDMPWVVLISLNLTSIIREIDLIISEMKLNQIDSSTSFKYYFQAEKNREDFPLKHKESYLSKAANLTKIKGSSSIYAETKDNRQFVAIGFPWSADNIYSIAIGREVTKDWQYLAKFKYWIQGLILILMFAPLLLAAIMAGVITKPLKQVKQAVMKIAQGEYNTRIRLDSIDEFSKLATHFNQMAISLQQGQEITSFISNESRHTILESEQRSFRENVSVLFCGIHNASDFHQQELQKSKQAFDEFIILCQTTIHNHSGIVDKFTGVALLAIFRGHQCADQAVRASQKIKQDICKVNLDSATPFHVGIGIATGPIILGEVGANRRKDFTCIGNTVNMAARLETLSKTSKSEVTIHIDHSTMQSICYLNPTISEMPPTQIKGKKQLQKVYEMVSL